MAYNSYFPVTYQPNYYGNQPYYQQIPQPQQQIQQQQQNVQRVQPTIQQGFVLVQSEQEARAYPVAPGNSITFKDETAPFCYVKTMGFNQLDRPIFERYRLVKEEPHEMASEQPTTNNSGAVDKESTYATKSEINALWGEIDGIKEKLKVSRPPKVKKVMEVEVNEDDAE